MFFKEKILSCKIGKPDLTVAQAVLEEFVEYLSMLIGSALPLLVGVLLMKFLCELMMIVVRAA